MRIVYITPNNFLTDVAHALTGLGHDLVSRTDWADVILCMSVSQMGLAWQALESNPHAKLYVYNWDVYDWSLQTPRPDEYDWATFKKLCAIAHEVWVPSEAEAGRYRRWTGMESVIVRTAVPFWTLPDIEPRDNRFVLDTLRETPDPHWGMAEKACKELGIVFVASKHVQDFRRYAQMLATCTVSVSTLREASTGGLGLVEASWYGKPCLVPNNPENAGAEYVPQAYRFASGDHEDLKAKLKEIFVAPPIDHACSDRERIRKEFSAEAMARAIHARLTL